MPSPDQTTARSLLATENKGTEVITRDSDGAVFIRQDVAERVIEKLLAHVSAGSGFPWASDRLAGWSIVGMNHYKVDGERMLFVSMERDGRCIKAEGTDSGWLWAELERQAFRVKDQTDA